MNEFNSWSEINWYALGGLLAQFAFLAAAIWFARNFLKTVRVFQEQIGALLRLSISGSSSEPHEANGHARRSFEGGPYWLSPETQTAGVAQPVAGGPGAWHRMIHWLQEPMHSSQISAWRRAMDWLQAPSGS